jgi:DNA-binding response OmpR family regulator
MATIVVADDDPEIRDVIRECLAGHTVTAATDGRDALDKIRAMKPDLAVLDVMMPHRDGFSVCRAVRADPALAAVRVMMLTAQEKMAEVEEGFAAGADDYVTKPFSPRVLAARVDALLAKPKP